jgi:hypothetical protein
LPGSHRRALFAVRLRQVLGSAELRAARLRGLRKEVYARTGTRILVRVFGGYDFAASDLDVSDFAENGYVKGVPMGGDLKAAPAGRAPAFLVRALRDPDGANFDRVQVIKGWLDAGGKTHEQIYDLAWSGDRKPGRMESFRPWGTPST